MNQPQSAPQDYERLERLNMIRDSAAAVVPRDGDLSAVRALRFLGEDGAPGNTANPPTALRRAWQTFCDQGWSALSLPEAQGGSGLGQAEYTALLEELGRGLRPEPLVPAVLVAALLPQALRDQQISGERLILPAGLYSPPHLHWHDGHLDGQLHEVALGACADAFVVNTAQGLMRVQASDVGVTRAPTQDGGHSVRLTFEHSPAQRLDVTPEALAKALDDASLGTAAELLGVMQGAFDRTLDYLKVRRQFGKAIGSFQALQHRCVDLKIQIELSRAIVTQAATRLDAGVDGATRARLVSAAKLRASRAALTVCREAIQLHGAIGYTDEADIGLFLRRALVLMNASGSLEQHQRRYTHAVCQEDR